MEKILLLGATGQLGSSVLAKLAENGQYALRIFVREDSQYEHLKKFQAEIVFGDLTDKTSIGPAVDGCEVVITTANTMAPRKKTDTFKSVEIQGYRDLIDAAVEAHVEQFIYTSAFYPERKTAQHNPFLAAKIATEDYLQQSGLAYTIFRSDAFMDVHFAFMGTDIPLRDEAAPTVLRPFPFMQNFYKGVKDNIAPVVSG